MGFRFWRRVKIAPGVTMNLSKSGASLSFGPRGAKATIGPRGKRTTVGIPGTGLYYTTTSTKGRSARRNAKGRGGQAPPSTPATAAVGPEDRLTLGFFQRLVTPDEEEALVDGCRELALGSEKKAFEHLKRATHLADGVYLAGFLALKRGHLEEAEDFLTRAADQHELLGKYFSKYGISAEMQLPITDEVTAHVAPDLRGVLLGTVELYQLQGRREEAIESLERLAELDADDVVVKLSLAELLLEDGADDKDACQKVVRLTEGIENASTVHAVLMLYKAQALRGLALSEAARDVLTASLRRKKDRPEELLQALRYERALVYEELGQRSRARTEFGKLYAEAPDYEDVAERLGFG